MSMKAYILNYTCEQPGDDAVQMAVTETETGTGKYYI